MLGHISNIQSGAKNFVLNHKVLTILALGLAILGIVFRGKIYSWIQQASTTTQRTQQTGTDALKNSPSNTPKSLSDREPWPQMQQTDQTATTSPTHHHLQNTNNSDNADKLSNDFQPEPENLALQQEIIRASEIELPSPNDDHARERQIIPFVYIGNEDAIRAINYSTEDNPKGYTQVIHFLEKHPKEKDLDPFLAIIPDTIAYWCDWLNDKKNVWESLMGNNCDPTYFSMIHEARDEEKPILIASPNQQLNVVGLIAYLVCCCDVTVDQALHFINTKGCNVQLTEGFRARLQEYYESFDT